MQLQSDCWKWRRKVTQRLCLLSLPERIFVQPITLGVIVQYRMSPLAGNDNILAAFDVYRVTEDRTDFLDTVQAIIERDDWTHAV